MSRTTRWLRRLEPSILRRSIGARVLAGFGLTAALAVAVALVSLVYNTAVGRELANVSQRDREVSGAVRDLEVSVEQQSGAVQNFLLSGDDRDLDALNTGRARLGAALAQLERQLPAGAGRAALTDVRAQSQRFDDIAAEEIALYRQGWGRSANFLWRTDGLATKASLLAAVQTQISAHNARIDAQIGTSRRHLRAALALSIGLVVLADVLALGIGVAIARGVTNPVRNLVRVASAVRGGDYSVRAPVVGVDELAALSTTTNAMVESLAASRAQLEAALTETERSEERYRLLAENATDIIFTLDRDNRFTFINQAVTRILGYQPADLIGERLDTQMSPRTQQTLRERGGWLSGDQPVFAADVDIEASDGRMVPIEVLSSVLRVNGVPVGVQGIARDMTERHRMEQELRRLHAQDRRRVDQLTTLNQMGRKIAALQPVDTLLPQMVRMLGGTFGYHHVRILLEAHDGELTPAAAWQRQGIAPPPDERPVSPLVVRALRGDAGFVAGSGRPEDDADTRFTEVAVPIRSSSGVIGVLDIRASAEGGLDESDIATLQTLADQIAVAIENARLYEAGQQLAVSEERNRLARELHDSVTQELFSMTMITGALPLLMERKPEVAKERVLRLCELSRGALAEMRALLFALRPAALAEEGLATALTKHAAAVQSREGLTVNLQLVGDGRLPHACEEALYRVFQEALHNVVKHARARSVWVRLEIGDQQTDLMIRDDGIGLDPSSTQSGSATMGMSSMRERVQELGGTFSVQSAPGSGTTIRVAAPMGASAAVGV